MKWIVTVVSRWQPRCLMQRWLKCLANTFFTEDLLIQGKRRSKIKETQVFMQGGKLILLGSYYWSPSLSQAIGILIIKIADFQQIKGRQNISHSHTNSRRINILRITLCILNLAFWKLLWVICFVYFVFAVQLVKENLEGKSFSPSISNVSRKWQRIQAMVILWGSWFCLPFQRRGKMILSLIALDLSLSWIWEVFFIFSQSVSLPQ